MISDVKEIVLRRLRTTNAAHYPRAGLNGKSTTGNGKGGGAQVVFAGDGMGEFCYDG